MLAGELLVFVEVRYRRDSRHGSAAESITIHKQRRIIGAAQDFLMRHQDFADHPCRFDVVALHGDVNALGCDWIAGAFSA